MKSYISFDTKGTPLETHKAFRPYRLLQMVRDESIIVGPISGSTNVVFFCGNVLYGTPLRAAEVIMRMELKNNSTVTFSVDVRSNCSIHVHEFAAITMGVGLKTYVTLGIDICTLETIECYFDARCAKETRTKVEKYLTNMTFSINRFWARRKCIVCKKTTELKSCSGCRLARYCSERCQRADYEAHKEICKTLDRNRKIAENALSIYAYPR